MGNNPDLMNSDYYKNFKENIPINIESMTFAIIPNKLIAG